MMNFKQFLFHFKIIALKILNIFQVTDCFFKKHHNFGQRKANILKHKTKGNVKTFIVISKLYSCHILNEAKKSFVKHNHRWNSTK